VINANGKSVSGVSKDVVALKAETADYVPDKNKGYIVFGQEYLSAFHKKLMSWSNAGSTKYNIVFSGDSTTAGSGTSGTSYHIEQLIKDMALKDGFPFITVVNNGQSGKDTEHWNQTYYSTDLTSNPDLLVLRWGINDPYYKNTDNSILPDQTTVNPAIDAQRRTVSQFETSLRSGLTKIRASKSLSQLSIILMVPNSVNDTPNGRDQKWIASLVPVIQKAARDFQCCFINTYQHLQDSVNASDFMDNPYGDGRHIHPNDVMNLWIVTPLYETIFPKGLSRKIGTGNLINDWNGNVIKDGTEAPSSFPFGISMYRAIGAGVPYSGGLITFKSADNIVYQLNIGYTADYQTAKRMRVSTDTWGAWVYDNKVVTVSRPTLQNSWVDYLPGSGSQAEYYKDNSSILHLQGLIKSGVTTAGTTLFTLPVGFRPAIDRFFSAASNTGFACVTVGPDGSVKIQSGGNGYLSLDSISFLV
jgi:lysophospholipase L1-like esterase